MSTQASGTPRVKLVGHGDTFELHGRRFKLEVLPEEGMGPPWKEHDGHGVVSDWTRDKKQPHQRILSEDRGSYRYYDMQASMAIALKDWVGETGEGTKGERAAKAVEADFKRLYGWCNDQWNWVWLKVTLIEGVGAGEFDTIGGVESDSEDYIDELARELAGTVLGRLRDVPIFRLYEAITLVSGKYLWPEDKLDTDTDVITTATAMLERIAKDAAPSKMPNREQLKALIDWAAAHSQWKVALDRAWVRAGRGFPDYSPLLQQVRNDFGPSWLQRTTLKKIKQAYEALNAVHPTSE